MPLSDLREILEDLYDAGFFAAYPSKKGRVSVRREAIEAAEEAIGKGPDLEKQLNAIREGVLHWLEPHLFTAYRRGEIKNPLREKELSEEIWNEIYTEEGLDITFPEYHDLRLYRPDLCEPPSFTPFLVVIILNTTLTILISLGVLR